jgi:hypothetical protein
MILEDKKKATKDRAGNLTIELFAKMTIEYINLATITKRDTLHDPITINLIVKTTITIEEVLIRVVDEKREVVVNEIMMALMNIPDAWMDTIVHSNMMAVTSIHVAWIAMIVVTPKITVGDNEHMLLGRKALRMRARVVVVEVECLRSVVW